MYQLQMLAKMGHDIQQFVNCTDIYSKKNKKKRSIVIVLFKIWEIASGILKKIGATLVKDCLSLFDDHWGHGLIRSIFWNEVIGLSEWVHLATHNVKHVSIVRKETKPVGGGVMELAWTSVLFFAEKKTYWSSYCSCSWIGKGLYYLD